MSEKKTFNNYGKPFFRILFIFIFWQFEISRASSNTPRLSFIVNIILLFSLLFTLVYSEYGMKRYENIYRISL